MSRVICVFNFDSPHHSTTTCIILGQCSMFSYYEWMVKLSKWIFGTLPKICIIIFLLVTLLTFQCYMGQFTFIINKICTQIGDDSVEFELIEFDNMLIDGEMKNWTFKKINWYWTRIRYYSVDLHGVEKSCCQLKTNTVPTSVIWIWIPVRNHEIVLSSITDSESFHWAYKLSSCKKASFCSTELSIICFDSNFIIDTINLIF